MISFPFLLKILKAFLLFVTLLQVTQCVRSSVKATKQSPTLVRGQSDPNNAYANPIEVGKKVEREAFYQHLDAHNLNDNYLRREHASEARFAEAAKERKVLSEAAKTSDRNALKLKKLAKQLGSEKYPNFDDRKLQRLRPNPKSKIQKNKSVN